MTIHTFQDSLAKSHEQESAPWWREIYEAAFPNFASMVSVRQDGWAQRGGIDRVVTLKSGRVVTIDEKVRSESYADILLERWSDNDRKTPHVDERTFPFLSSKTSIEFLRLLTANRHAPCYRASKKSSFRTLRDLRLPEPGIRALIVPVGRVDRRHC